MRRQDCVRETGDGLHVVRLSNSRLTEAFITVPALAGEDPTHLLKRLYDYLEGHPELRLVRQDVFGVIPAQEQGGSRPYRLDSAEWPLTWIEEGTGKGGAVAGIQAHAVAGVDLTPIRSGGRVVGTLFEDAHARYCVLGGVRPDAAGLGRREQALRAFTNLESVLGRVGMSFRDVFRTWFYLDDILAWYGEFNEVRNRFFQERGVYAGLVPASTGVGGSNGAGAAVVADLLAIQPKNTAVQVRAVPSPLQCPALEYGSSFSRAVELRLGGHRRLYVSGTASIALEGRTLHREDVDAQVAVTMEVVEAILVSRQMSWADVIRAIGYFKHGEDVPAFGRYCAAKRLPELPAIISKNDICRDDLLFEIEVDAIRLD